ncbi:MAG TPA: FecR domain-containing protein [Flavisolibacter sp.]|nr:FecR domain-containing protein [Flavisolibacter sp.]
MDIHSQPDEEEDLANEHRIARLIAAFIGDRLSVEERIELDEWVGKHTENLLLFESLTNEQSLRTSLRWFGELDLAEARLRISGKLKAQGHPVRKRMAWYAVAACFLLAIGLSIMPSLKNEKRYKATTAGTGTSPDYKGVVLILANGRRLMLDSLPVGDIQAGNDAVYKSDSMLQYTTGEAAAVFHTLYVPAGQQYALSLSDGSKVWLNAGSSLRYPSNFNGGWRGVELNGEAYFEIAKNGSPFTVNTKTGTIRVLGTRFNVQAYEDGTPLCATLVEGGIALYTGIDSLRLRPGQAARVSGGSGIKLYKSADIEQALGWKSGMFIFRETPTAAVLQELQRWYDLDISWDRKEQYHFSAFIRRDLPLDKVLGYLEGTGNVKFDRDGRKLTVMHLAGAGR